MEITGADDTQMMTLGQPGVYRSTLRKRPHTQIVIQRKRAAIALRAAMARINLDERRKLFVQDAPVLTPFAGLIPVTEVDGRAIGEAGEGELTRRLSELYRAAVAAEVKARQAAGEALSPPIGSDPKKAND